MLQLYLIALQMYLLRFTNVSIAAHGVATFVKRVYILSTIVFLICYCCEIVNPNVFTQKSEFVLK